MEGNFESQISTFKVDFGCSEDCPMNVKNMLQQLKGVKSISINPNQGKVIVVGNVNPMMLIKLRQKTGREAQLWSFDRAPMRCRDGCHPKQKYTSHCCFESNDSMDESSTDSENGYIHRARYGQRSRKKHGQKDSFGLGNKHAAPPLVTRCHPPMSGDHNQPFLGYYHYSPMPWFQPVANARPVTYLRPMSMYGHYGRGQPVWPTYGYLNLRLPKYNPMIHYTSYADNYRYSV